MNANMSLFCGKLALGLLLSLSASTGFSAEKQCAAHYIQLFATSVPAKANKMQTTLSQAGFKALITPFNHNGKALYRVRTGPYSSKSLAVTTQQRMKTALQGNANAQNSIIVTGTTVCNAVFSTSQPQNDIQDVAQCYHVKGTQSYEGSQSGYVSAIQFTERQGKINGYYFYRPEGRDGAYGSIRGTRVNNQITGQLSYFVEGDTGTDNINYQLGNNTLIDGNERYNKVSCSSVKELIDVAKDVSQDSRGGEQDSTTSSNRTSTRFRDYKAPAAYNGKHHALVMNEFGRMFRTRLRDALNNSKPSFAGQYIVTGWGCGSSCYTGAVINAKTGVATPFPVTLSSVFPLKPEFKNEDGQEHIYRLDSRLMIFAGHLGGAAGSDGSDSIEFYEFKDDKFIFIEARPYGRSSAY